MRRSSESTGPGSRSPIPSCRPCAIPPGRATSSIGSSWPGWTKAGLRPVGDADRADLLRRVTFDLTGLPPTPAEIDAFLKDASPDAVRAGRRRPAGLASVRRALGPALARRGPLRRIDRFLAEPSLSARLALSRLRHRRRQRRQAVRPVRPEQIAGDLLPAASTAERDRQLIATGFLALGVKDVNQRFKVRFIMDNVDEQIDTVSRSVLGLTVSCARCHDHKFDPIPTTDYYALAGIFPSTDLCRAAQQDGRRRPGLLRSVDAGEALGRRARRRPSEKVRELEGQGRRGEEGLGCDPRHAGGPGQGPERRPDAAALPP